MEAVEHLEASCGPRDLVGSLYDLIEQNTLGERLRRCGVPLPEWLDDDEDEEDEP